jgi:sugar lactone lactonase YvrE/GAF domain-containing protein
MTSKQRFRIGLTITAAMVIVLASYGAWRIQEWNARGWAGMNFLPAIAKPGVKPLLSPRGVAIDRSGNVYVADFGLSTVVKFNGSEWATLAGSAKVRGRADGLGSSARFDDLHGIATDNRGNVYVADTSNATIRKITPSGLVVTFAGQAGTSGSSDGLGSSARFNDPKGLATDSSGNVYVADSVNNTIRKITPARAVTTLAGLAGSSGDADGSGSAARFDGPEGVATDASGNVYVADTNNHTIRRITPAGKVITLAGKAGNAGFSDGLNVSALFTEPTGVAIDSGGNLYVADSKNHAIRKITPEGLVRTFAGRLRAPGNFNGVGRSAQFNDPRGVAIDRDDNLYVAEVGNAAIRKITRGGVVSTLTPVAETAPPIKSGLASPGGVIAVYPGSPADRAGIRVRDQVLAINAICTCEPVRLAELDRRLKSGSVLIYRIQRNGQEKFARVVLESPLRSTELVLDFVATLIVSLSFVAIGLLVFRRRTDDRRAVVFFAMTLTGAFSLLASVFTVDATNMRGMVYETSFSFSRIVTIAFSLAALAFLPLTLHLALIFPKERPIVQREPHIIRWIYAFPLFPIVALGSVLLSGMSAALLHPYGSTPHRAFGLAVVALILISSIAILRLAIAAYRDGFRSAALSRPFHVLGALILPLMLFTHFVTSGGAMVGVMGLVFLTVAAGTFLYPIATCVALYRSYTESGAEEKRQVKWPLWGTMVAIGGRLAVAFFSMALALVALLHPSSWEVLLRTGTSLAVLTKLLYLLIPASFAFAILKYRLMDIDIVIKKTVLYTMLSGVIVVLYFFLVGGLGTVLVKFAGVQSQTMIVASTLVVAIVFVPLRNRLQYIVDRNLFRQHHDYSKALRGIGAAMVTANELPEFLTAASEQIQQALQNRATVLFIRKQSDLVASAKVGLPDSILGSTRVPADGTLARQFDGAFDPRTSVLPEEEQTALRKIGATLLVPIRSQSALQGFVALGSRLSDQEYAAEDSGFVASAADQIAVGIDHFRLKKEEVEFAQAREMQQMLLPHEISQIEGLSVSGTWQPARIVGGDYFDVIAVSDHQLALCIGDVAGKGMPAALLMSSLQAAVRASIDQQCRPDELCSRAARVVIPNLSSGRFITFFFCLVDTDRRSIGFCNAGHNPPILVRADGQAERLAAGGPVLNRLFRGYVYSGGVLPLRAGDRLVLFTDGVTEARNKLEEDFGEQRLERLIVSHRHLEPRVLQQTILESVAQFCQGNFEDDVTLVILGTN